MNEVTPKVMLLVAGLFVGDDGVLRTLYFFYA
jgi:hypothetical protein